MQDIRGTLQIQIESPYWDEAFARAQKDPQIPQWLTDDYILALEKDFSLLGDQQSAVLAGLAQVRQREELSLLAKTLYHIIAMDHRYSQAFTAFQIPQPPAGVSTAGYDLVALFPILGHIPLSNQLLKDRGVDDSVIYDTLNGLRINIRLSSEKAGRSYFSEYAFSILGAYIYTNSLNVGRLRFEIYPNSNRNIKAFADHSGNICLLMHDITLHRDGNILGAIGYTEEDGAYDADFVETDDYFEGYAVNREGLAENKRTRLYKKDWKCILQPGDALLKVHIPTGPKLTKESCDDAYRKAVELFPRCYPEHDFKGFVCNTWLLAPIMKTFLKEDSNIVKFQEPFHIFPAKNDAPDVFWYVFKKTVQSAAEVNPAELPEGNSMQRGVKSLLLQGKFVHQFNGFIPF